MGIFDRLFGKSRSGNTGGMAVIVGSGFTPSQDMVQRFSRDGHLEGCASVSTINDPIGWSSHEDYEGKAIAGAVAEARRTGRNPQDYKVVTQHGDFPKFGGKFYVVRLIPK